MAKDRRFIEMYSEGSGLSMQYQILVDKVTGVNYLMTRSSYAAGLTVLLDSEGKPVITPVNEIK